MEKKQMLILMFVCSFLFAGCEGISRSEYDAVCAERDALIAQIEEMEAVSEEPEDIEKVRISGTFVATVRELMPDYCLDATTLNVAVITLFQDGPFAVYVGEEIAAELQEGTTYVFEIMEQEVEKIIEFPDPKTIISLYHLRIKSVRLAEDEECGLDSVHIVYTEID